MSRPPWGNDLLGLFRGLSRIGSAAAEIRSEEISKVWATSSIRPAITKGATDLQETITNALQDPQAAQAAVSKNASEAYSRISLVAEGIKAYRTQTAPPFTAEGTSAEPAKEPYDPLHDPNVQELSIEDMMLFEAMSGHEDHSSPQGLDPSEDIIRGIGEVTDAAATNVGEVKSEILKSLEGFEPLLDASKYQESEITEEHIQALDLKLQEMEGLQFGYNLGSLKNREYGEPVEEIVEESLGKVDPGGKVTSEGTSVGVADELSQKPDVDESSVQELSVEDVVMQEALSSSENLIVEQVSKAESSVKADIEKEGTSNSEVKSETAKRVEEFDNLIESLQHEEKEITQEHLQAVSEKLTEIQSIAFGQDMGILKEFERENQKENDNNLEKDSSNQSHLGEASETASEFKTVEGNDLKDQLIENRNVTISSEQGTTKVLSEKESAELELDNTLAQVAKSVDLVTADKTVRDFDVVVQIESVIDVKAGNPDIKPPHLQQGYPGPESSTNVTGPMAGLTGAGLAATAATTAIPGLGVAVAATAVSGGAMAAARYQEKERLPPTEESQIKDEQMADEAVEDASQRSTIEKAESSHTEVTAPVSGMEKLSTSEKDEHSTTPETSSASSLDSEEAVGAVSSAVTSSDVSESVGSNITETSSEASELGSAEIKASPKVDTSDTAPSSTVIAEDTCAMSPKQDHLDSSKQALSSSVDDSLTNSTMQASETVANAEESRATSEEIPEPVADTKAAPTESVVKIDELVPDGTEPTFIDTNLVPEISASAVDAKSSHSESSEPAPKAKLVPETSSSSSLDSEEAVGAVSSAVTSGDVSESVGSNITETSSKASELGSAEITASPKVGTSDIAPSSTDIAEDTCDSSKHALSSSVDDSLTNSTMQASEIVANAEESRATSVEIPEPVADVKAAPTESVEKIDERVPNGTEPTFIDKNLVPEISASAVDAKSSHSESSEPAPEITTPAVDAISAANSSEDAANLASEAAAAAAATASVGAAAAAATASVGATSAAAVSTVSSISSAATSPSKTVPDAKPKPKPKLLGRKPLAKDKPKSTLAENAQARKVPHSRLGRMLTFGSLAAGLGAGTIAEMTRRTLGVNDGKGSGSLLDASPFLTEANAKRIVDTLCKVRGAALKLGQMMSIQDSALINPQVQKIFERVRQSADFMPSWQLEKAIREQLGDEWKNKVATFDEKPFAAASIGQVHLVKLHDGRSAAMKIQYPGVAAGIESDINNLISTLKVANLLPEGLYVDSVIEVAKRELGWECDYVREAACTDQYRNLVRPYSEFYVPETVPELCTPQIFTSELIEGIPVDKCVDLDQDTKNYVCEKILRLCLLELFNFGFMQTDPNWSNFFYNADTEQLALLDFGACRSYDKSFVDKYIHIIHGAAVKDREKIIKYSQELGFLTGYEAKVMVDAHVDAIMILGEAFQDDRPFHFGSQDTTHRIQHLVPVMLSHRMCAPPEESYSLHRKMSGVFLLCAKLNGVVSCKRLFEEVFDSYKFGGTWEEFHASLNG